MSELPRLRVGIVGCGYQGGRLAMALPLTDSMVLTACTDIDPQAALNLAGKESKVSVYSSLEDMLANSDVDVVMVATPHHVLAEISRKAVEAGKHVLVEKPCGVNAKEIAQVAEAAAKSGVSYLAGYSFRYIPSWYKVFELIQEGVIGEIQAVMGFYSFVPMNQGWASRPETGGGPLLFIGSHLIDQVLWYMQDDPVEVFANVRTRHDTQVDETSAFQINFAKGATAQLMVTQATSSFSYLLNIIGRSGSISLRPCGFLDFEIIVTSSVVDAYKQPTPIHIQLADDVRNIKHTRQLNEFASAIHSGRSPFTTLTDAGRVLKVVDAVFASDRSGEPVHVD
jgi:predicted dehydrogenase